MRVKELRQASQATLKISHIVFVFPSGLSVASPPYCDREATNARTHSSPSYIHQSGGKIYVLITSNLHQSQQIMIRFPRTPTTHSTVTTTHSAPLSGNSFFIIIPHHHFTKAAATIMTWQHHHTPRTNSPNNSTPSLPHHQDVLTPFYTTPPPLNHHQNNNSITITIVRLSSMITNYPLS